MALIWSPVDGTATWTSSLAPPQLARAAIKGQGWLVATVVAGGWSVAFVPDPTAVDPPARPPTESFHGAKIDWFGPTVTAAPPVASAERDEPRPAPRRKGEAPGQDTPKHAAPKHETPKHEAPKHPTPRRKPRAR